MPPSAAPASPSRPARGPLARLLVGLWLVLHVFTVAALPVVDGFVDHGDAVVAHIEDVGGGNCPPNHAGACDLCHFTQGLRAVTARATSGALPVIERSTLAPDRALAHPAEPVASGSHGSRAPPALG